MGKKVLVVGGGGRCHAIVDALSSSPQVSKIYCAPGNAGIAAQAECVPLKDTQVEELKKFALDNSIDLTVVGPEASLALGIVDEFEAAGLRIFGPSKSAATIESSKDFAKRLMAKYGIPTAAYRSFTDYGSALEYVRDHTYPVVLKYDGLAAGKGVVIAEDFHQADSALKDMLSDNVYGKESKVVIEEFRAEVARDELVAPPCERAYYRYIVGHHLRVAHLHKKPVTVDRPAERIDSEDVPAAVVVYIRALEKSFQPCFGAFVVVV